METKTNYPIANSTYAKCQALGHQLINANHLDVVFSEQTNRDVFIEKFEYHTELKIKLSKLSMKDLYRIEVISESV